MRPIQLAVPADPSYIQLSSIHRIGATASPLQACDFFADERGVQHVSKELGSRLFRPPKASQQADEDSGSVAPSLGWEGDVDVLQARQTGSENFWSSPWKTC